MSVKLHIEKSDLSIPSLVSFPQGIPTDDSTIEIVMGEKGSGRHKHYMVSSDFSGMYYNGFDTGDYASQKDAYQFAVGFVKEGDKEMTLRVVDHAYVMKPHLVPRNEVKRNATLSSLERRQSLTEEFGSRKKKRALNAAQSNIISSENIAGASAVETTMSAHFEHMEPAALDAAEEALQSHRLQLLPKYEESATTVEEAYPIADLYPHEISEDVGAIFEALITTNNNGETTEDVDLVCSILDGYLKKHGSAACVITLVRDVLSSGQKKLKKVKSKLQSILFLHYLVHFYKTMSSNRDCAMKKEELYAAMGAGASEKAVRYLCNKFANFRSAQGKQIFSMTKTNM